MENLYETLIANLSGGVRREKLDGREFFVAPLSLVVPGILNGNRGPLLYTKEDAKKHAKAWDNSPIVVYHPTRNGKPISASDPAVVHIGVVKNSKFSDKVQAEAWIDVENAKEHDERVYDALVNGTPMEVSTGLGTDIEAVPPGTTLNGEFYTGIARNWRSDHLAILPDQTGACSLRDGCGLMVNKDSSEITDSPNYAELYESLKPGESISTERILVGNELKYKITKHVENCDDSGECEACKAKRLAKVANEEAEDVTNCKGEVECPKCKAKRLKKMGEMGQETPEYSGETTNSDDLVDNAAPDHSEFPGLDLILNQLSHDDLRQQLYNLVQERFGTPIGSTGINAPISGVYVQDVFDKDFIYQSGNKYYRLGYSTDLRSDKVTLSEDQPTEVKRATVYKSVQNLLKKIENCKVTGKPGPCKSNQARAASKRAGGVAGVKGSMAKTYEDHLKAAKEHETAGNDATRSYQGAKAKLHWTASDLHKKAAKTLISNSGNVLDQIVANGGISQGRPIMADKKLDEATRLKLVDHLITNSEGVWEEGDREVLNKFDDVKLYKLAKQAQDLVDNADPDEDDDDSDDDAAPVGNKGKVPPQFLKGKKKKAAAEDEEDEEDEEMTENARPMSEAEWLAQAPKSIRSVVQNAQRREAAEKQTLIANMTEHLDDEQKPGMVKLLNSKSLDEVQALSGLNVVASESPQVPTFNYAGQAMPIPTVNRKGTVDADDVLPMPTINWKQESKVS